MGLLDWFDFEARGDCSNLQATIQHAAAAFLRGEDLDCDAATPAGVSITPENAKAITTVYACVKIIAWNIASLPLVLFRQLPDEAKERALEHPLYRLLYLEPNPEQSSFEWRALMSAHQNLWGAGISEIETDRLGNPVALWPLAPWEVVPVRSASGRLAYQQRLKDGSKRVLLDSEVLVFPALSTRRDRWESPIRTHRDTLGAAVAVNQFGARTFGQGVNPSIAIMTGRLGDKTRESLKDDLRKNYAGLVNAHRAMVIEEGQKIERISLPPEDAQYLGTRQFDISEISRIYNVPLHLLNSHEKATTWGRGLEELNRAFVSYTLRPYLVQWEQELQRRLIIDNQYFAKFIVEGLLRGNIRERYDAYQKGRAGGWLSANDIRRLEDMNPLPGEEGDIYLVPLNMQDAGSAGENEPGDNEEGGDAET